MSELYIIAMMALVTLGFSMTGCVINTFVDILDERIDILNKRVRLMEEGHSKAN